MREIPNIHPLGRNLMFVKGIFTIPERRRSSIIQPSGSFWISAWNQAQGKSSPKFVDVTLATNGNLHNQAHQVTGGASSAVFRQICELRNILSSTDDSGKVRVHMSKEHEQIVWECGWYMCDACNKKNWNSGKARVHMRREHEQIVWECGWYMCDAL